MGLTRNDNNDQNNDDGYEYYNENDPNNQGDNNESLNKENESKTTYNTKSEMLKRSIKSNAKKPLNSICECGSKKKYKNCCAKKEI